MSRTTAEFLHLAHPVGTHRWELPITGHISGHRGSLFGGAGLAAGIVALEQASGRQVVWATGQYLALVQQPVTLDLEVVLPAVGRGTTQGRAIGHLGEKEVITVFGAMGDRPEPARGCWVHCPDAPPPEACREIRRHPGQETMHAHLDLRLARGMFGFSGMGEATNDGRSLLWARARWGPNDAGALAIIADYMPSALGNALGRPAGCTSLDNTIRFADRIETDWVLCDNRMEFVGNGFGYGHVHMWSRDGTLLATASQSVIVRLPT